MENKNQVTIIAPIGNGKEKEVLEAGIYRATCYGIVVVGTKKENFNGDEKNRCKIMLFFELPDEMRVFDIDKGEQPFSLKKEYTFTMFSKSSLRKDLEAWRGKDFTDAEAAVFNISTLLGVGVNLGVGIKTSRTNKRYNVINSLNPNKKHKAELINKSMLFNINSFDLEAYLALPVWLQNYIADTPEFEEIKAAGTFEVES